MKHSLLSVTKKTPALLAVLAVASTAKAFYRGADQESLEWLLAPTAFLVEILSGIAFDSVPGLGWINGEHEVIIAPSCSGMNYLVILFCMSSLCAVMRLRSLTSLPGWLVFSALASYAVTLVVNSLRIWLAVVLYNADIYSASVTAESVHRLAGVSIYYFFMVFYYLAVSFILNLTTGGRQCPAARPLRPGQAAGLLWPLCCYLLFTVGLPYFRGAASGQRFQEHAWVVAEVSIGLTVCLGLGLGLYVAVVRRLWSVYAGREHNKA